MLHRGRLLAERSKFKIRELTKADLEQAYSADKRRSLPAVARFRDSHHMVARLFAMGLKTRVIAERTGYSQSRILVLASDPSFKELIESYRDLVTDEFKDDVDDYMAIAMGNMLKAERMIADKLDTADAEGETLPVRELVSISRDAADRFGYGKKNVNFNVNADFASMFEKAVQRSSKILEGRAVRVVAPPLVDNPPATSGQVTESPHTLKRL